MIELAFILFLSIAARDEAAMRLDESVQRYIDAVYARSEDLAGRRQEMDSMHIALRAILERERMREVDLATAVAALREAGTVESGDELRTREEALRLLRSERERYLARRTVIEREQQASITAALVTSQPAP
jgi:hypothetical protein